MNPCKTSIIIPCYKAVSTLRRAVESALEDAPADVELLLVDDGSPDATGALCDELAAGDARITALHRPNGGAGAARNTGLDTVQSGYTAFCDSLDRALNLITDEMEARPAEDDPADAAIHFALLSYAAGVAASRYISALRAEKGQEPEDRKKHKKAKTVERRSEDA